jgi:phosphatidylserine/phosphatidylglycerophosphate/cardiolipin synthase-like enzyme
MNRFVHRALLLAAALLSAGAASAQTLSTFPESDGTITPVYTFINSATKTLDMTMYEFVDTTAQADLIALAKKGVTVRVILDQNNEMSANEPAYKALTAGGVSCHWANPNYAVTHQKTITVDGKTSMIMTLNLTSRYYSSTRDFAITDTNAADVAEIETVFNADFVNGTITPTKATSLIWSPNLSAAALESFINAAQHTLLVENEEMSNSTIVTDLANRAKAGVAVTVIMTNDDNDYESEFETLTKAGVKVYTYADNESTLYIHAKVMVEDEGYSTENMYLGSINFSTASLTENRELGQTTQVTSVVLSAYNTLVADYQGGTLWTKT